MSSIITFYSFKGGVGRSMALANIAYLLAKDMGKRVLAVDWDLEAPGLEKYFGGCPGSSIQDASGGGLIDLLTNADRGEKPDWRDYVSTVNIGDITISLITSGRRNADYPAKVLDFGWQSFFENSGGGAYIESLRDGWREFDFTLIDSRTGFTDSGGVCTVQLPDILVPVFTTTEESARGAIDVIERAQAERQKLAYDRSRLLVFPLPSRYDGRTQYREAREWLQKFADWFAPQYSDWLPRGITPLQIIERTKLPYIGYFSFGTQMPAAVEGTSDPESLGYAYNVAASIIANEFQQVDRLVASDPAIADRPSREELALLRMLRALQESKFEWRSIDTLASAAGIGVSEALDILRGEPEVSFGRGKSGRVIVRRTDPDQDSQSSSERFMIQRDEARATFALAAGENEGHCTAYFESVFFPDRFEKSRFSLEQLRSAALQAQNDITGWPFLYVDPAHFHAVQDGYETVVTESDAEGNTVVDFWRLHQSGLLYHRTAMRPDSIDSGGKRVCAMDFRKAAIHIALAIDCLARLYDGLLSADGEVSFSLTLIGTENRRLASFGSFRPLFADYVCRIPEIAIERKRSVGHWREGLLEHALEIANEIYLRFNWISPNLSPARGAIEQAFASELKHR